MGKLLLIDGLDRTGKDTLAYKIFTEENYKHSIMNRGILSNIAYAIRYDRGEDIINSYIDTLAGIQAGLGDQTLTIMLVCEPEELQSRIEATCHEPVNLYLDEKAFNDAIALVRKEIPDHKIVVLDTTLKTPDELYSELLPLLGETHV